ncbi:uncharacterized protein LOC132577344 [Heteronotia binoei]|uniref:uncharacterized protein LOC132577344 n=1 Tax=Heteronotia binoei TaxID=13085 RepID=UPI00293183B2|nr:uncharacterized protein LOC132577344 [Heteronotia binoei]
MKITTVFWYLWSIHLVFSVPQQSHLNLRNPQQSRRHYDATKLEIEQDDASVNLPPQPLAAPVSGDAATYKLKPFGLPAAMDQKADAAHEHLQQRPAIHPNSQSLPDYELLEPTEPLDSLFPELSDDDTYEQKTYASSDVSDDYYEEESFLHFDEDDEDSLYPGVVEEHVTEEEVADANDEIELTDDFLTEYLTPEDVDMETETDIETETDTETE